MLHAGGQSLRCACVVSRPESPLSQRGSQTGSSGGMVLQCQVELLYFAKSAEITGIRSETISVSQEIKTLYLWNEIKARYLGLADVRNQVILAVSQEYVKLGEQLLL